MKINDRHKLLKFFESLKEVSKDKLKGISINPVQDVIKNCKYFFPFIIANYFARCQEVV